MKTYQLDLWPSSVKQEWVTGIATIFLSYSCHPIFFYLRGELRSKTDARVKKVIRNSIFVECILYLGIGIAGYVSLGNTLTPEIFFVRKPLRKFWCRLLFLTSGKRVTKTHWWELLNGYSSLLRSSTSLFTCLEYAISSILSFESSALQEITSSWQFYSPLLLLGSR